MLAHKRAQAARDVPIRPFYAKIGVIGALEERRQRFHTTKTLSGRVQMQDGWATIARTQK